MILCTVVPALVLGALVPASAPAAIDMYLELDGVPGESQHGKNQDAIDVLAWSWGMSNSSSFGATSVGKTNFQDISITKYIDRSSPVMLTTLATGKVIPKAKLTVLRAGDPPKPYLRLCFTGVRLTSLSTGGSGGEDRLTENVSFNYATVVEAYAHQKADGSVATVFGGWDLLKNIQYGDPTC